MEFRTVKLLCYETKHQDLEHSGNPFAFVTASLLEIRKLRRLRGGKAIREKRHSREELHREELLYQLKKQTVKKLLARGFSKEYGQSLLKFLDWAIQLPDELEERLENELTDETGGETMPYVTNWERRAMKRGMEEGLRQGRDRGLLEGTSGGTPGRPNQR